jgi:hypothetical protein
MAVWLVRAGRRGEQEQSALDHNLVTIGWNELPDLSSVTAKRALTDLYRKQNPDASPKSVSNNVGQVWAFRERIKEGDLAVLPLHIQSAKPTELHGMSKELQKQGPEEPALVWVKLSILGQADPVVKQLVE